MCALGRRCGERGSVLRDARDELGMGLRYVSHGMWGVRAVGRVGVEHGGVRGVQGAAGTRCEVPCGKAQDSVLWGSEMSVWWA